MPVNRSIKLTLGAALTAGLVLTAGGLSAATAADTPAGTRTGPRTGAPSGARTPAHSAAPAAWTGQFTGFAAGSWAKSWGETSTGAWGFTDAKAVTDPTAPGNGSALEITYGAGSSANSCSDCPNPGGAQFYTSLASLGLSKLADGTTLDLKYHVRFPAGYDWGLAGKLPGLYGGTIGQESGGNHGKGWSTRYMWRGANGVPDNGEVYLYTPTDSGPTGYGVDEGLGDWKWTADGNWHTVEQLVNRGNGDVTVWYDGVEVAQLDGIATGIGSIPFSGVLFSTFYGGHDTSWGPKTTTHSYFADFSLSATVQH